MRVTVPESAKDAAVWRVHIGDVPGVPGEMIAAPSGTHTLVVRANAQWPQGRAVGRLEVTIPIEAEHVTEVRLPVPESLLRAVITEGQPAPRISSQQHGGGCEAAVAAPQLIPRHRDLQVPWLGRWQRRAWTTFVPR